MAYTIAKTIINRAKTILQDVSSSGTRWPNSELQNWLNDAQKEIILFRPDAHINNENFDPIAGQSKQTIPAAGLRLIEIVRNTAASSQGGAIRMVQRSILDDQVPNWHRANQTVDVEHWIYDERDPKTFYLYPNPSSVAEIEIIYSTSPPLIDVVDSAENFTAAADTTTIGLDDIYANAVLDYILYRAYSKDAEYAGNAGRASSHYSAFANSLGIKTQTDSSSSSLRAAQGVDSPNT